MCVPGVLAPFHWTTSSPVPGFDSRLRSVGGDRAEEENEHGNLEGEDIIKTDTESGWERFILTGHHTVCGWYSLLLTVYDRLYAVGVLHSRSQARYVNTPRVRGHVSGGFSTLTGSYSQLKNKCRVKESGGKKTWMRLRDVKVNVFPRKKKPEEHSHLSKTSPPVTCTVSRVSVVSVLSNHSPPK